VVAHVAQLEALQAHSFRSLRLLGLVVLLLINELSLKPLILELTEEDFLLVALLSFKVFLNFLLGLPCLVLLRHSFL